MRFITFLVTIKTILAYEWLEFNDQFDCIVGIAIDKNPASVGVFISTRTILTSANPLNHIRTDTERVLIYTIKGNFNVSKAIKIEKIANNQSFRKKYWVAMGSEATEHTSIHDIALITISESNQITKIQQDIKVGRQAVVEKDKGRRPFPVKLPNITTYQLPMDWAYAGFGYLDQNHVQNNTILEVSYSSESLTNCDEWIPREWGRFICILDNQESYSLASGAPLFEDGDMNTVHGIGCFSLKNGKNNLLVFTDLRPYINKLYGYIEDSD